MKDKKYDSAYAHMILKKYEKAMWKKIHKKLPKWIGDEEYIQQADRLDVYGNVAVRWLEVVNEGKFRGEHGDASALAHIYTIIENESNDFLNARTKEEKNTVYEPENPDREETPIVESIKDPAPRPEELLELQEKDEFALKQLEHLSLLHLRREHYSIYEISRILGISQSKVKRQLTNERELAEEEARKEQWADTKPSVDESIKLTRSPSRHYDQDVEDIKPEDEKFTPKFPGFYKGHTQRINRMREVQNSQTSRICVKCHRMTEEEDVVVDNTLVYCRECHRNLKKYKTNKNNLQG